VSAQTTLERPHVWQPGSGGPPLLLLHGTGADEHDLLPLGHNLSPSSPLLSPRGAILEGSMPRFFRRLREGVFDEDDLRARTDELAEFVTAAGTAYDVEAGSWVAVGFSNGANIASSLLMRHPQLLSGAVLLAAMVPYRQQPAGVDLTGRWAVVANGQRDPMATPAETTTLVETLRSLGAQVEVLSHEGGHTIDQTQLPRMATVVAEGL